MAQIDVNRKPSNAWWRWLLLIIAALAILFYIFKDRLTSGETEASMQDSTGMTSDTVNAGTQGLAANGSDWKKVDFKSPSSADAEITDKDIRVSKTDTYTMYRIETQILFGASEDALLPAATQKLAQVAASLNRNANNASIVVFGSGEPAKAVKTWLVENGNIAETSVSVHAQESKDVTITVFKKGSSN
jgi:outer membrane protein OmpA-like peptidoglycan-associated protein